MNERQTARVIVAGFVEHDGKLLVIREIPSDFPKDHTPIINQPAGHVEKDELATDAVVREVLEETGYRVKPVALVGVHQVAIPTREHMTVCFMFHCELTDEARGPIEAPEVTETLWLTKDEIMSRVSEHRSTTTTARFNTFFSGARFPLEALTQISI